MAAPGDPFMRFSSLGSQYRIPCLLAGRFLRMFPSLDRTLDAPTPPAIVSALSVEQGTRPWVGLPAEYNSHDRARGSSPSLW